MSNTDHEAIVRAAIDKAYASGSEEHLEASDALDKMVAGADRLLLLVGDIDRAATYYRAGLLEIRDYCHDKHGDEMDKVLDIAKRGVMNGSAVLPRIGPHYIMYGCLVTPEDARHLVASLIADGGPDAMSAAETIGKDRA